jgi:ADP-heptose:LPS heptosyltransferase
LREPERILVVRAGALGDTLMATPLVSALHERSPGAEVDVLCSALAAPLFEHWPRMGTVHRLRYRNLPYGLSLEKRRLVREIRGRRYDYAVLLERAPRYRELLERAGIEEIRSFRETPFDPETHAIVNNLNAAGVAPGKASLDMTVHLTDAEREVARKRLEDLPAPRVGIHIGYGPSAKKRNQTERLKGWPLASFRELCGLLLEKGLSLVFTGSRDDRQDVARVTSTVPEGSPVLNLAGATSLRELAAVVESLDAFVSVDSGPAHLAAALRVPLVVLWGPAIFAQVRPLSSSSPVVILRHPPPCAPCYDTPLMKSCRRNICMEAIGPREVAEATETLLAR